MTPQLKPDPRELHQYLKDFLDKHQFDEDSKKMLIRRASIFFEKNEDGHGIETLQRNLDIILRDLTKAEPNNLWDTELVSDIIEENCPLWPYC